MDDKQVRLRDLWTLLDEGVSTGTLATAIEQGGIWGWDRYARFTRFEPASPHAGKALDLVAAQAAWSQSGGPDDQSPVDEAVGPDNPFVLFGWPEDNVPDFGAIESGQTKVPRPQSVAKSENANLAIIGHLLAFIQGKLTPRSHPDYGSEADLIKLLSDYNGQFPGLGRSNLQAKFAAAKRHLNERAE